MKLALACVLVALLVAAASAAPGTYFTAQDKADFTTLLKGELKQGEFGSIYNSLAAVEALALLNTPVTETAKLCESANKGMSLFIFLWNVIRAYKTHLSAVTLFQRVLLAFTCNLHPSLPLKEMLLISKPLILTLFSPLSQNSQHWKEICPRS